MIDPRKIKAGDTLIVTRDVGRVSAGESIVVHDPCTEGGNVTAKVKTGAIYYFYPYELDYPGESAQPEAGTFDTAVAEFKKGWEAADTLGLEGERTKHGLRLALRAYGIEA